MSVRTIFNTIFKPKPYFPQQRIVDPKYFLNDAKKAEYCEKGFVVIEDVVSNEAIELIEQVYKGLYGKSDFFEPEGFMPSPQYGKTLQSEVTKQLEAATALILPNVFDLNKCSTNILNLFVVKEAKGENTVTPHMDVSLIDEYEGCSSYLWIPTCDVDDNNGAMLFIPGSHKWAAWQRTHDWHNSPIEKNREYLQQFMVPVYVKKGDLIIFDSATIHGSMPNRSNKIRIAINTSVCDKDKSLVHYVKNANMPRKSIGKYKVDAEFWNEGNYIGLDVPDRYEPLMQEKLRCSTVLSKDNIKMLIEQYD